MTIAYRETTTMTHTMIARSVAMILAALLLTAPALAGQVRVVRTNDGLSTLSPNPPGEAPIAVRATATATTIGLRWVCPPSATGYEVFAAAPGSAQTKLNPLPIAPQCLQDLAMSQQGGRVTSVVGGTMQTSYSTGFTHTGLTPGREFTYAVRALYASGAVGDAAPITMKTTPWPPPAVFTARAVGRTVTLQWQPIAGAMAYRVFRRGEFMPFERVITASPLTATTYADENLPAAILYYYVEAVDGLPTQPLSVITGRPTNLRAEANMTQQLVMLRWEAGEGATTMTVSRAASATGPWATIPVSSRGDNNAWDNSPVAGVSYYKVILRYPGLIAESDPISVTYPPRP